MFFTKTIEDMFQDPDRDNYLWEKTSAKGKKLIRQDLGKLYSMYKNIWARNGIKCEQSAVIRKAWRNKFEMKMVLTTQILKKGWLLRPFQFHQIN